MPATLISVDRGRLLQHIGIGLTIGYAVVAALFIGGETFDDPAGWPAVGLVASWAVPLLVLAAIAWYWPGAATLVLAVATAVTLALSGWFAAAPDAWRSVEDTVGPVRALVSFVVAVPLGLLGRQRPGPAAVLLLVVGVGPIALADLAGIISIFAVTSLSVISAPAIIVGCLYLLSAAVAGPHRGAEQLER